MRSYTVPADADRNLDRQAPRQGGVISSPDAQTRRRLKMYSDLNGGEAGEAFVMIPSKTDPYFVATTTRVDVFNPVGGPLLSVDDEIWAAWQPRAGLFIPLAGTGGAKTAVAVTTTKFPARVDRTPGGAPDGINCTIRLAPNGTDFVDGSVVPVYWWAQTESPDPADQPNGELYIYISLGVDGLWWCHAVDCTPGVGTAYEFYVSGDTIAQNGVGVAYVGDGNPTTTPYLLGGVAGSGQRTGVAWSNVNNVLVDDATQANVIPTESGSEHLWVTDFQFSTVPPGSTIDDVIFRFRYSGELITSVNYLDVILFDRATAYPGNVISQATTLNRDFWPAASGYFSFDKNDWDVLPTEAQLQSNTFGVGIAIRNRGVSYLREDGGFIMREDNAGLLLREPPVVVGNGYIEVMSLRVEFS